jgi:hypothetical protein
VFIPVLTSPPRFWTIGPTVLAFLSLATARADDFTTRDEFFTKLSAPMTSIVDGKAFRDALGGIAAQAQLNLWLDRGVDPTAPIAAGPVGPTIFHAIQKLADRRDCTVMPVASVLLVGRPEWVDRTAASIISLKTVGKPELADISWDDLTTPAEAMAHAAAAGAAVEVHPALPHDLWPATAWNQIDRRVAVTLILAQFDRTPKSTESLRSLNSVAATSTGRFTRRYSRGKADDAIRSAMRDVDRESRVRTGGQWLVATGTIAAHRAGARAILEQSSRGAPPDPDKDKFTLTKMSTTAENALRQLARSAHKTCLIDASASGACKKTVSIEGKDVTLRKLIDMVAAQAGVVADWQGDTIVISRPQ